MGGGTIGRDEGGVGLGKVRVDGKAACVVSKARGNSGVDKGSDGGCAGGSHGWGGRFPEVWVGLSLKEDGIVDGDRGTDAEAFEGKGTLADGYVLEGLHGN